MQIIYTSEELLKQVNLLKQNGQNIGFVPTLGALHQGHMSLISQAKKKCDIVVCSIFVNPTQFDDKKDLEKYPRTFEQDKKLLEDNNCDILFYPSVGEVYPNGKEIKEPYSLDFLENILEGATRPGHYQGVAQVVHRLLEMVMPDVLFLGQKDFQQVLVLQTMIDFKKLPVKINSCEIIREPDGLAMSSRNRRLNHAEREVANSLFKTLQKIKENNHHISIKKLKLWAEVNLNLEALIEVDYISFRDAKTFKKVTKWNDAKHVVVLGAIKLGPIRLIDNMIIR